MAFNQLKIPYDDIYVISLKRSHNRRIWIEKELKKNISSEYQIIDAIDSTDKVVERLYRDGAVKLFPPCFRCGKEICKCDNNVLIESQVATFCSHMEVWKKIANSADGLYLIIEDDIKFNWYYKILHLIYNWFINKIKKHKKSQPLLIRLAWALNDDHHLQLIRVKKECVRMSNPAYAVNTHMANVLVNNFKKIETTVDIYVHKHIAPEYGAYTMFPPIAHELSYSLGHVESLIRPRKARIDTLFNNENDQSKRELSEYQNIIEKVKTYPLLVIGFPGNNIFRLQKTFYDKGLKLGKEEILKNGLISWVFTVSDLKHPYSYKGSARSKYFVQFLHTIIFVEDPRTSVKCIIDEIHKNDNSYEFIKKHILLNYDVDISATENITEQASLIYIYWSMLLQESNEAASIFKQEEDFQKVIDYLEKHNFNIKSDIFSKRKYLINRQNKLSLEAVTESEWLSISRKLRKLLNRECNKLGYVPIFDTSLSHVNKLTNPEEA